jgi:BASS family bile acid:Na+ symporter
MHPVDQLQINFNPDQLALLNWAMAFLMFAVSLDIRVSEFKKVLDFPKPVLVGVGVQYLLFPLLTLCIIMVSQPPVSMALGMILVSMCPSGNMTNFLAHYARGNIALSITLNAILILSATVLTPAGFWFWSGFLPEAAALRNTFEIGFFDMVMIILKLIIAPLALGMALHHYAPAFVNQIRSWVQRLALIIFFSILVLALLGNRANLANYLGFVFLIVLVQNGIALTGGYWIARALKLSEPDCRTLSFEAGVHNTALGLLLIFRFFDGLGGMALIAAWYGIWDLVSGYALAHYWRSKYTQPAAPTVTE